ncbi:MAG: hypothetical protein CL608_03535 [Anaerolineaceae bacterium]|nr:hypothetical protein [Anaerolineaceae bacterium]
MGNDKICFHDNSSRFSGLAVLFALWQSLSEPPAGSFNEHHLGVNLREVTQFEGRSVQLMKQKNHRVTCGSQEKSHRAEAPVA